MGQLVSLSDWIDNAIQQLDAKRSLLRNDLIAARQCLQVAWDNRVASGRPVSQKDADDVAAAMLAVDRELIADDDTPQAG